MFLPRYFLPHGSKWVAVACGDEGWLATVYTDSVLVTQLDDDPDRWTLARREGAVTGVPTSSSSMPTIMAVMLEGLDVTDGQRALEIGTGTGYNAGLLSHRLGDRNVSTVDIDATLVRAARTTLASIGYLPECAVADGERGYAASAPYDRVLCTCAVSRIPLAWLEQTRPGGLVLTALNRPIGGGLVRLVAGENATGRGGMLAQDGRFMPMRRHRADDVTALLDGHGDPVSRRPTALPLSTVLDPAGAFEFFVGVEIPGVAVAPDPDGGEACYLVHPDRSWVRYRADDGACVVEQGGTRPLWDLVEHAYERWRWLGEPARQDFGVEVSPDGQFFTLGDDHRWRLDEATV